MCKTFYWSGPITSKSLLVAWQLVRAKKEGSVSIQTVTYSFSGNKLYSSFSAFKKNYFLLTGNMNFMLCSFQRSTTILDTQE